MLLSRRTTIKLNSDESNVLGHMCYAAYFIDNDILWNADAVGAYNILRLYAEKTKKIIPMKPLGLSSPTIIKVAV